MAFQDSAIEFVEIRPMNLSGYTLIEGFPGMGLVGTIATKYLSEKLNLQEIGYLDSDMFMPIIRVHDGLPVHPTRIYVDDKKRIVLLVSEQIVPQVFTDKLGKAIVDWIQKKKIKRVISLSGIRALPAREGKQRVYGIASDNGSKKMLNDFNIEVIKEGITSGITALMMLEFKDRSIEAFSLLGNVQIAADYKAAAALIEKLNEMLGLSIDVAPLQKEAKETEKALLEHIKKLKQVTDNAQRFESQPQTPMYT
ncbi:MAG: proteasome assembly chaperone family protein [Candidatus Diapherotrites archaeon]|uniref:Proteasome assembly chaperone family protein n=1 Tax=Candidatus Iainarchaeum sp. TaxID=3101447 RepID=A0A938YN16_9ARCH|nr:proteasome assembly chaperone family protein [Candidatus Diapherotrites archaeon]